jgi:hypothetical protein
MGRYIDYEEPRLVEAMENYKNGCLTAEDHRYMQYAFRKGNGSNSTIKKLCRWFKNLRIGG